MANTSGCHLCGFAMCKSFHEKLNWSCNPNKKNNNEVELQTPAKILGCRIDGQ